MKIIDTDLDGFASDLVEKCISTRRDRIPAYDSLKHYYLFGAPEGQQSPYGKIYAHLDLLCSYLYSQGTVEFDVAVSNVPDIVYSQAELLEKRLNVKFHERKIAGKFYEALKWSLIFNSSLIKLNWQRGEFKPYIVEPHNFGVLQEDVPTLNDQEAFVHCYKITKLELERRISMLPGSEDMLRRIQATPEDPQDTFPESVNRIIVAGMANFTSTTTRGMVNVPELFNQLKYKPKTVQDMVEMYELWVWDDDTQDYRTITVAAPGVVIYGRKDIGNLLGIKGTHPFVHICPNAMYDYFWGWSEIVGLIKLQDWMNERLREIKHILTKQANPPKSFSGFGGISDEKFAAMDNPGSWISDPSPSAKMEFMAPDMPDDIWHEIVMMQSMFNDVSGLSEVLQGKGESGVRAKSHADTLAKLGSSRIKTRAQIVESQIADVGTLMLKMMQKKDAHRYDLKGAEFVAAQFSEEFQVKVDAHSASPVFADDHTNLALALAKFGAIGPEGLLMLTKPPKLDFLMQEQKKMQEAKAKEAMMLMAAGDKSAVKKIA